MRPMVFESRMMNKKKKKEEERRRRKKDNNIETFKYFFQLLSGVAELLGHFNDSIAKAFCL